MENRNVSEYQPRRTLPVPMFSQGDFSLWSVLKNGIGKDLSNIAMPVVFNEPLSFLQRMVEYMEYAQLLRYAAEQSDPIARMQYVAAFAVSALASNWERLGKPFNPLLGETYELERPEFRVVCEQVSHHPPISAFHADSEYFVFHGSIHPKLKFWGKSVEIQPKGVVTVELPKWGEAYTWSNVNCCVHNVIVGKLWIEQYGTMEIVNHSTGLRAVLTFKPAGWFSKELHRVEGFIMDKQGRKYSFLYGKWTEFIKVTDFASYELYYKENVDKFKSDGKAPNFLDSPAHTPKKVLAKLNSFKMGTLKSMSMSVSEPDEGCEDGAEGADLSKCDSTYSIDIPNSSSLWEAEPRPENSSEVEVRQITKILPIGPTRSQTLQNKTNRIKNGPSVQKFCANRFSKIKKTHTPNCVTFSVCRKLVKNKRVVGQKDRRKITKRTHEENLKELRRNNTRTSCKRSSSY